MKFRVTYKLERGTPGSLVQHAITGQEIEADDFEINPGGALTFWKHVDPFTPEARAEMRATGRDDMPQYAKELVIGYSPGTWRTVALAVGAAAQQSNTDENPPRRTEEKR